jgi:hypothetical protein
MIVKNNYTYMAESEKVNFLANGDLVEVMKIRNFEERYGLRFATLELRLLDYADEPYFEAKVILDTLYSSGPSLTREQYRSLYDQVSEDYADLANKTERMEYIRKDPYLNALQVKFAYAITWVGAWIGLHMPNSEVAGTAGLAWIFPFTFASNIFTPVATMPEWLQPFVLWNPVSCLALAARQLFGNPTPLLGDSFPERYPVELSFAYCFLLLAIFAPLAVRAFKTRNK